MRLLRILLPPCEASTRWLLASVGTSGALHVVAAVVIASVIGAVSPHLVPPPQGRSSVESSVSIIVIEAAIAAEQEDPPAVSFARLESPRRDFSRDGKLPAPVASGSLSDPVLGDDLQSSLMHSMEARKRELPPDTPQITHRIQLPKQSPPDTLRQPTAASAASVLDAGQLDKVPATIHSPRPQYPADALAAGVEGRVVLRVELDRAGRVTRAVVAKTSGQAVLDEAARRAVATWKFEPATRLGIRVATAIKVPVVFKIERD